MSEGPNHEQPWRPPSGLVDRSMVFRGNYGHFLVRLVAGLLLAAPLLYLPLRLTKSTVRPGLWTVALLTLGAGLAALWFYRGPMRRRQVALDEFGISYTDELRSICAPWNGVETISLHSVEAFFRPYPLCYAKVVCTSGEAFAFASFGTHPLGVKRNISFGDPPAPIVDIKDADLLLALIAQETRKMDQLPILMTRRDDGETEDEGDEAGTARTNRPRMGLWALLAKLGLKFASLLPKVGKVAFKGVKLAKPGLLGLSAGLYAAVINWKFAVLIVLIIVVHELGHVWAMKRAGMRVKGIYFIPFFGAATVSEDLWPSWKAQARVNLAGPVWGLLLTLAALAAHVSTGYRFPFLAAVAAWGGLLNLLNLLPVNPLDGGRIVGAVAYSLRSRAAFGATFAFLVVGVLLGLGLQLYLIYVVCAIGLVEFVLEHSRRKRAEAFALLKSAEVMDHRDLLLLKSVTGINFGERNSPAVVDGELRAFRLMKMINKAPPMTPGEIAVTLLAFGGAFLTLLATLILTRSLPGARMALEILR